MHQLSLMKGRPFNDHGRRSIRELPFKKDYRINPNLRLNPGIDGMEVWRIMIVEIHANHDAEETADFWHWPPSHNALSSTVDYIHSAGSNSATGLTIVQADLPKRPGGAAPEGQRPSTPTMAVWNSSHYKATDDRNLATFWAAGRHWAGGRPSGKLVTRTGDGGCENPLRANKFELTADEV